MKSWRMKVISMGLAILAVQCAHKERTEDSAEKLAKWHQSMHRLSESLSRLLPLTASPRAFNDPKNRQDIANDVQVLKSVAHAIDVSKMKPGHDPAVAFMAQRFSSNMDEALVQLETNRPYARRLIQQSTAHCISCHTRTDEGRSNLQLSSLANVQRLTSLEQVEFFIAVRDYDRALERFDQVVNSPDAQILNPHDMEMLAEKALAIVVRVKRDSDLANEMVSRIIDARWAPVYLRLNALTWKRSIEQWEKERPVSELNAKEQFRLAKLLINKGNQLRATSPLGQAGLIYFLRASSILHELLAQSPNQAQYGEELYHAGLAAEALRDMNLWTLQEAYYEACIRHSPRTALAKKCYVRLEQIQLSGYATDDGGALPREVRDRLIELKGLSQDAQDKLHDWGSVGE